MEIDNKIAAAALGSIATIGTVLARLIYAAIGHRIKNAEQAASAAAAAALKIAEQHREDVREIHAIMRSHQEEDRQQFREVLDVLRQQNGDLEFIRGKLSQ